MCSPGEAVTMGGMATQAVGGIQEGRSYKAEQYYAADIARENARISRYNSKLVIEEGINAEATHRSDVKEFLSQQIISIGQSGFSADSEAAQMIREDTLIKGEAEALAIRRSSETKAAMLISAAKRYGYEAETREALGDYGEKTTQIATLGTLLSSGSGLL